MKSSITLKIAASTKMERQMWNPFLSMKNSLEFETYILCLISDTGGGGKGRRGRRKRREKVRREAFAKLCKKTLSFQTA